MTLHIPEEKAQRVIGLEGGGTKTDWVYLGRDNGGAATQLGSGRLPAANFKLIARDDLERLLLSLPRDATHVGVFLAGCSTARDHEQLRELAARVWPSAQIVVGGDRDSGFAAAFGDGDGILVISGTGSAVHGRRDGRVEKAGGWGQLLGDRGSGFDIGLHGLRHCLRMFDVEQRTLPLARVILRDLGLNRLRDLVTWAHDADKFAVANLAPAVFEAARDSDSDIVIILEVCARRLAEYAWAVAKRLEFDAPEVRLLGGVFLHNPEYVELFKEKLVEWLPEARVEVCTESGAMAAARLAMRGGSTIALAPAAIVEEPPPVKGDLAAAETEQPNPRSSNLDRLETPDLVDLFVSDEEAVTGALASCRTVLGAAVDLVHASLGHGGRLFYVGAGTSGRLGVLDASEIPPTFSAPPGLVQGIIAGGFRALHRSVEGAEDSDAAGGFAVEDRGVTESDVVCGITASGYTPFVFGALRRARKIGSKTILITCNPGRRREDRPWDVEIDLPTGPELIAGSTRLKAGTATKLALNIISTCAMIRLGKVKGNLMVDLDASNVKLRDRAARIVSSLMNCSYEEARSRLAAHDWSVRKCLGD